MQIYKILSVLLSYPEAELVDSIAEIQQRLDQAPVDCSALKNFLASLRMTDLISLQERYVQTFDRTPSHSLHLFEHLHGEDRVRGQAMVDLLEEYKQYGFESASTELPDYLPLFLEFLSVCPSDVAADLLGEAIHVIAHIGNKLQENQSPYAPIFTLLQTLSPVKAQPLATAPVRDMDEALERFGPGVDGTEPLSGNSRCESVQPLTFYPQKACDQVSHARRTSC